MTGSIYCTLTCLIFRNLADLDADGALDFDEFCIAMHIVVAVRHGLEVPQFLPLHLVPEKYEKQCKYKLIWINIHTSIRKVSFFSSIKS